MLANLATRVRAFLHPQAAPSPTTMLDQYVHAAPTAQTALDAFAGEWWTAVPSSHKDLKAGPLPLAEDSRITWAIEALGGVAGQNVLELGPLEAGHTYMLEQAGAASVLSIEASTRAFLKCLVMKEVLGLQRSHFMLGDFEEYLRADGRRFDVIVASGVLYHVRNPVELIANLARATDRVFMWTHYYLKERVDQVEHMAHRFAKGVPAEYGGFKHTLYRQSYKELVETNRFAGGSEAYSSWIGRDDLMGALRHFGLTDIRVGVEEVEHQNGPSLSLVACRPGA
jgi:SAM-dependent methyltransferase